MKKKDLIMKILVAETNQSVKEHCRDWIRKKGFELIEVSEISEALAIINETKVPMIVVIDVSLATMGLHAFCQSIENKKRSLFYLIAMFSEARGFELNFAFEAGVNDVFSKRMDCEELFSKVLLGVKFLDFDNEFIEVPQLMASVRILVVEDDEELRGILVEQLQFEMNGVEILEAANGEAALALLTDTHVDLIICDLCLPKMNGVELLKEIKEKNLEVGSVILMTGLLESSLFEYGFEVENVNEVMFKPFMIDQLLEQAKLQLESDSKFKLA